MSSWSKNRKRFIGSAVVSVFLLVVITLGITLFYTAPSCFDGRKNGNEQGIDCGGSCVKLCNSSFMKPNVAWTRYEEVATGLYNIAAYIVNPNTDAEAKDVPYHMAVYDAKGMLIVDHYGTVVLPPHRNTLAYEGAVDTGKRVPAKIMFEFTGNPDWYKKADPLKSLSIGEKNYSEDESGSSLSVVIGNNSIVSVYTVSVYAILYDNDGNALGFSKTIIDEIPAKGTALAPFTWPVDRHGAVISIEVLPVAE